MRITNATDERLTSMFNRRARRTRKHKRIAVIGGGLGGIAMGVKLKKAGFEDFTIFEAQDGPGGTWWINDYPGAAVDIPSRHVLILPVLRDMALVADTC
ncbi:NAD(P)-binding protein [Aeromicrobium sp. UC242_57]|uniref:NAD(P)-binding protein n=1 Tax=Aeromicrobium sp. UC242_57 TaxID=3374624 RepID=UPI0037B536C2